MKEAPRNTGQRKLILNAKGGFVHFKLRFSFSSIFFSVSGCTEGDISFIHFKMWDNLKFKWFCLYFHGYLSLHNFNDNLY